MADHGEFSIELGEKQEPPQTCSCCGKVFKISSYGFVCRNQRHFAVYFGQMVLDNPDKFLHLLISINHHLKESGRRSIFMKITLEDNTFRFHIEDARNTPFAQFPYLGTMLSREEGQKDPLIAKIYELSEKIIADDPHIVDFFSNHLDTQTNPKTPSFPPPQNQLPPIPKQYPFGKPDPARMEMAIRQVLEENRKNTFFSILDFALEPWFPFISAGLFFLLFGGGLTFWSFLHKDPGTGEFFIWWKSLISGSILFLAGGIIWRTGR